MSQPRGASGAIYCLSILIVAAGALALRAPRLAETPMHTDEAVHAVKLGLLYDTGRYVYDPQDYHGPTLYYFTLPLLKLSGATDFARIPNEVPLRLVPVIFGTALILLLFLLGDGLGRPAVLCAAVLTAVSPAMVYYSRVYIQELPLLFFTFAVIAAGWRYARRRGLGWALATGGGVGLMLATKETGLIVVAAMVASLWLTMRWNAWSGAARLRLRDLAPLKHALGAAGAAIVAAAVPLTSFFNPAAIGDFLRACSIYGLRAGTGDSSTNGAGLHHHPWDYYLRMLAFTPGPAGHWWSEALILILALVGIFAVLSRRSTPGPQQRLTVFLAFYTILMTGIYCLIPYKTPWCMLGFLHGMILMAGIGGAALWRWAPTWRTRALVAAVLVLGVAHLGIQAWRGAYVYDCDPQNPYVYAHTTSDVLKLTRRAEELARVHSDGHHMVVKVIVPGSDYWPLPWYLRRFDRVGYWSRPPGDVDAPLVIASPDVQAEVESKMRAKYVVEIFGLRPDVLLIAYIRQDLWDRYLSDRSGS